MIENAQIENTMLGIEDHGIMTFFLDVRWHEAAAAQGFGGYALDGHAGKDRPRAGHGRSYQAIRQILETVGVDRWEKLPGTLVRIERDQRRIVKIGHIIEDRWFDIEAWVKDAA